jgi:hypothetical protein
MRLVWSGLMAAGLLMVGLSVYESRADRRDRGTPAGDDSGWVATASQEDGTGFPPPDPTPPPPPPR